MWYTLLTIIIMSLINLVLYVSVIALKFAGDRLVLERRIELALDNIDVAYKRSYAACNNPILIDEPYIRRAIGELKRARAELQNAASVLSGGPYQENEGE